MAITGRVSGGGTQNSKAGSGYAQYALLLVSEEVHYHLTIILCRIMSIKYVNVPHETRSRSSNTPCHKADPACAGIEYPKKVPQPDMPLIYMRLAAWLS